MKTTTNIIVFIFIMTISMGASFAKKRTMTMNQFQLKINKVDSSLVGTWEKSFNTVSEKAIHFCQFNANGTFITFKKNNGTTTITGRGNWKVENNSITIIHGNEITNKATYQTNENTLVFSNAVSYSKSEILYVNK